MRTIQRWATFLLWATLAVVAGILVLGGCARVDDRPAVVKAAAAQEVGTTGGVADAEDAARAAYLSQVQVRDVTTDRGGDSIFGPIVSVRGEVKNLGTRTLSRVQITVYFLDASGQAVGEKTHFAVLAGVPPANDPPLRPHYSLPFAPGFTDVPSEFAGKVLVKVTDVEFAK